MSNGKFSDSSHMNLGTDGADTVTGALSSQQSRRGISSPSQEMSQQCFSQPTGPVVANEPRNFLVRLSLSEVELTIFLTLALSGSVTMDGCHSQCSPVEASRDDVYAAVARLRSRGLVCRSYLPPRPLYSLTEIGKAIFSQCEEDGYLFPDAL